MADDDTPTDPFEPVVPEFEDFTGPHADDIRALIHRSAQAKIDFSALVHQRSFRELGVAIDALNDQQCRDVLLCALVVIVGDPTRQGNPERFQRWIEQQ